MNIGPHTEAAIKSINAGNSCGTFGSSKKDQEALGVPDYSCVVKPPHMVDGRCISIARAVDGRYYELTYPITGKDCMRVLTDEESAPYRKLLEQPKFNMMQRIRETADGTVWLVLGTPSDRYVIDETNEPAYLVTMPPSSAWGDDMVNPVRVVAQKKIEKPGAYVPVTEVVPRGMNPTITHIDDAGYFDPSVQKPAEKHLDELGYDIGYTR